jgi:acetylornithine deacetylase
MRAIDVTGSAELEAFIAQHSTQWHTFLQRLVGCPSTFEQEHSAVALVEEELAGIGLSSVPVAFDAAVLEQMPGAQPPYSSVPNRRNVVARLAGRGGGRSLILSSHLDVVPAEDNARWTYPPFSGVIVDGVLYGRGSFDDKAGVAICLALLHLFSTTHARPRGDIIAHFVVEEEITGNGTLLCLAAGHAGNGAIIVDGTRGTSGINQHAGNIRFGVSVAGALASVSVSHMGINAAEMLARFLLDLRQAVFGLNAGNASPWTVFPSPNQISTVALDCRETLLTVPAEASAVCYATFTPPLKLAGFRSLVENVAAEFAKRHQLPRAPMFEWNGFATEPVASSSEALERAITSAAARTNREISFGPSTGISDLRHFAARGIPCVLFGPGAGYNPHRTDEHVYLETLWDTVRILFHTINDWCG